MIITLIIWTYLAFITLAWGVGTLTLLRWRLKVQDEPSFSFSILAIWGLSIAAWLSSILSIFMKMGWLAHGLVLLGAIVLAYLYHREIWAALEREFSQRHWAYWMLFALGMVVILLYAVKAPTNPDTPLYHAQSIHWIEEFPVVPGLANLDVRFGSNSNWFTVSALFSLSFLGLQSFHLVPSFLFLACFIYFMGGFQNILNGEIRLSDALRTGFIPVSFYVLIDEISSPGTDLPVILFYWLILCLCAEWIEHRSRSDLVLGVVFFFSLMAMTYKVSGVLILLIGLWLLIDILLRKEYRTFALYLVMAVIALLPWMIRNFVLSGYWLFPEPAMALVSPPADWRVPIKEVLSFKQGVQAWAIAPRLKWDDIAGMSLQSRYSLWFAGLTLNRKGIFAISLVSPVLFYLMFILFKPAKKEKPHSSYWILFIIGYLNLLFWFFSAPNFRFGYGFMLAMGILVLGLAIVFAYSNWGKYRSSLTYMIVILLCAQQLYVMVGARRDDTQYEKYLVLPAPYALAASEPCTIGDLTVHCARNWRQCGYDAFPCLAAPVENVEPRGTSLRTGFRSKRSQ
jgi:hypothetical protein